MVVAQSFDTSGEVTRYAYHFLQSGLSDHPASRFAFNMDLWKQQLHPKQLR